MKLYAFPLQICLHSGFLVLSLLWAVSWNANLQLKIILICIYIKEIKSVDGIFWWTKATSIFYNYTGVVFAFPVRLSLVNNMIFLPHQCLS